METYACGSLYRLTQCWKTEPNHTSGKIKLAPPADCYTILLLVSSQNLGQTTQG